ncbi:hypothetical protein SPF06_07040 [Sinomonas sp. JGH33]|uniref:HK97 gp10 family phage protein n=1 Tax=Sinomonas terricola TaxID=3110330 RepID=A0ABU5T481_9MICC|nr:hypothetical protein [Sinomonas sp. JGH33]MEA5454472.1 hypothetical protein [Sinomonas sp. JGH33]
MADEVKIALAPESLALIRRMAKEAEPTLRREVNRTLRGSGSAAVAAVKAAVLGDKPPKANQRSKAATRLRGARYGAGRSQDVLRRGIAGGVAVRVRGGKYPGIRIVSTDTKLSDQKKAMNRVYRLRNFRHPVFGSKRKWAAQHGKDFFYGPIRAKEDEFRQAVHEALQQAAEKLGGIS